MSQNSEDEQKSIFLENSAEEDNEKESLIYNSEEELFSKEDNSQNELKKEDNISSHSENEILVNNKKLSAEKNLIEIEMQDSVGEVDKEYELLFCVQGIGKKIDNGKSYEKHQFCEPSLRDIHRFLRNDDSENPQMKYLILNWKTAEMDIIPLMLNYENSEKIQQLGLVLLTDLTEPQSDLVEKRPYFEKLLTDLQEHIVKSQLVELLSNTLADATAKLREATIMRNDLKIIEDESILNKEKNMFPNMDDNDINENNIRENLNLIEEEKRKKNEIKKKIAEIESKSEQIIELVFVFFKQLLNIYFSNSIEKNTENMLCFIRKFSKYKIFDAIIYHSQAFETEFSKRLSPVLLELNFLLIRPFEPIKIFEFCRNNISSFSHKNNININNNHIFKKENNRKSELALILEQEKKEKNLRFNQQSHRPNNFGTTIKITRPLDNSTIVVTNFNQFIQNPDKIIDEKMNTLKNQRKKTIRKLIQKNDKVNVIKISEEIKFINDFKISENISLDFSHQDIIFPLKHFCEEFLKYCFNYLVKYFISEVIGLNDTFEKFDFYNLINLITFYLNFERLRIYDNISNQKDESSISQVKSDKRTLYEIYDLKNVIEAISPAVMDFVYK